MAFKRINCPGEVQFPAILRCYRGVPGFWAGCCYSLAVSVVPVITGKRLIWASVYLARKK
ncbi:MAG: hypothetical protein IPI66_15865 [Chitinophagaceae bacterium]|nr:hypothetical protein [Chitinophagaceae bacterium]